MSEPSPIGRDKHCTCQRDHTGELLPTGCPAHSLHQPDENWLSNAEFENMATRHRHGRGWKLTDEGAAGFPIPNWLEWTGLGLMVAGIAIAGFMRGCA